MKPLNAALSAVESADAPDQMIASISGLLIGYDARWRDEQRKMRLTAVEEQYTSALVNPDTGAPSKTWKICGVLDKRVGAVIYDHKTTSSDITDPAGFYWKQLTIAGQPSHYELIARLNGMDVERIVWDVTRKPRIKPKTLPKKEQGLIAETGHYCGFAVSEATLAAGLVRENDELFCQRVARDCLDRPDQYFARRSVPRTAGDLTEYAVELWQIGCEMRDDRRRGTAFKNPAACYSYGTPCEYLPLCAGEDLETSDRWQPRSTPENHIGGADVLSHSRIQCWQTCRRKHRYRYEVGIERFGERSEALDFGSLWHRAMDAWWTAFDEGDFDGDSNEQSIRRIDSHQEELAF